MKAFTKEQLDFLKQFEENLHRATYLKYYRGMGSKKLDEMKAVYDEATEGKYNANWSCSHCVLSFLQAVGKKYFEDKKAYEEKAAQLVDVLDEVFGEVPDEEPVSKEPEPKAIKKATAKKTTKKATTKKK